MKDIFARELKGHNILAVERFRDETRWMIEFSVKKPESTYGVPGDEMRLFLTEEDYRKALQSQLQFAPHGGHWCVCQRPPGGAQRPPSLRYFDRLNNNNVMLRCPLHNSVG